MNKEINDLVKRLGTIDKGKKPLNAGQLRRVLASLADLMVGAPEVISLLSYYGYYRMEARYKSERKKYRRGSKA